MTPEAAPWDWDLRGLATGEGARPTHATTRTRPPMVGFNLEAVAQSDPAFQDNAYLLIDATHLGHGVLLERVHPPELEPGACKTCFRCPCYCALLDSYDAQ